MAGPVNYELLKQAAAILREAGASEVYLFGSELDGTMGCAVLDDFEERLAF